MKSLSRLLGAPARPAPALYLSAFGKHPGWNDHLDDQGLDTDALVTAKRLLYVQGISQNIDAGAWEKLEPQPAGADPTHPFGRLDQFRHDFLWHRSTADASILLAGRMWSSTDGKGRDKYPMVLCSQLTELPDQLAAQVVLPFLAQVHERCASAKTAETVRQTLATERDNLRARIKDSLTIKPMTARQVAQVAGHKDLGGISAVNGIPVAGVAAPVPETVAVAAAPAEPAPAETGEVIPAAADPATIAAPAPTPPPPAPPTGAGEGFHRIVYQFAQGMSGFRTVRNPPPRTEQVRLPTCGMSAQEALLFWLRFALTFVDKSTPLLLIAPDQTLGNSSAPWVDVIVGEPTPQQIFCIKAGTRSIPFTSDIPYTLDPGLVRAIDGHIAQCASLPENAPMPKWPML